uniref:FYVE-type domain-containing protein n=1 Tax=Lotharella globosa TaxID=91324 RepID=A0A7S3YV31_9EUKA
MFNWLNKALQEPSKQQQEDEDSGEDDFDSMKWLMQNIKEEGSEDVPVGASHVSNEEWKEYEVEVVTKSQPPISRSGWLQKRGRANQAYKRRFCEIRGNKFFYYHSEKSGQGEGQGDERRGEINLLEAHVSAENEGKGEKMVRTGDFSYFIDPKAARKHAVWIGNEEVRKCMNHKCQRKFGVAWRRHHCRYCGRIFCINCITTGRGRKLKNQPAKVEKQGYDGVKICRQCALFPATRMTRPFSLKSATDSDKLTGKRSTLPSKIAESTMSLSKGGKLNSTSDATRFNSAPVSRSQETPAELPASFLLELERPIKIESKDTKASESLNVKVEKSPEGGTANKTGINDLNSPTEKDMDDGMPAQLPVEWMKVLSSKKNPDLSRSSASAENRPPPSVTDSTMSASSAPPESTPQAESKSVADTSKSVSDFAERKANSIKRRRNRQNAARQTFTTLPNKHLNVIHRDVEEKQDAKKEKAREERAAKKKEQLEAEDEGNPMERSQNGKSTELASLRIPDTVVFSIQPSAGGRRYYFQCESPISCAEWVRVLTLHTKPHNKSVLKRPFDPANSKLTKSKRTSSNRSTVDRKGSDTPQSSREPKRVRFSAKNQYYKSGKNTTREERKGDWLRTGYLAKVGMQIRTWRVRFFALRRHMLTYFKISGKTRQQRGVIWLKGAEVIKAGSVPVGTKYKEKERDESYIESEDTTPTAKKHSRNPTQHLIATHRDRGSSDEASSPGTAPTRYRLHSRNVSSDSLEPNVRKEKTRYVHEFVIKTRQQPKCKTFYNFPPSFLSFSLSFDGCGHLAWK